MPYLQPATANYFGFQPATRDAQVNAYPVSSSEGAIYMGGLCALTSFNTVRPANGTAATANIIGVAAESFAANAGSTTMTNRNKILIYDAPDQLYTISDSSSGVIGSSGVGLSYFTVSATGVVGSAGPSTTLLRSVQALSGAVQASSAGVVKIVMLHPVENNVYGTAATGAASVRKWIVSLRSHAFQTAGSVDLLTT